MVEEVEWLVAVLQGTSCLSCDHHHDDQDHDHGDNHDDAAVDNSGHGYHICDS